MRIIGGAIIAAVAAMAIVAHGATMLEVNGLVTEKVAGWRFEASGAKGGVAFNPLEGWYPDKGGKLVSPRIAIPKAGAYYKLSFTGSAPVRSYETVALYDAAGNMIADNYDVIYEGEGKRYARVVFAQEGVKEAEVFFQSPKGCTVSDVKFEPATVEDAAKWCDGVYAKLPPLDFAPVQAKLPPKTLDALKTGKPWRILMLGDSIMQDTFHSQFHALVKRAYPKSDVTWLVSVRGSTGCWYYCEPENFRKYVADYKPDCVFIGGNSGWIHPEMPLNGGPAIASVARRVNEELGAEVVVMTPTLAVDLRVPKGTERGTAVAPSKFEHAALGERAYDAVAAEELKAICAKNGWPLWDMFTPAYDWLFKTGLPSEFYSRDYVHSGELGKQVIGRIALGYFTAAAETEGGARVELPLDGGWSGSVSGDDGTVRSDGDITLPHNWDDYYGHRQMFHGDLHGTATYHRVVHIARRPGERQFLVFDGAGTFLTVRLNGKELCRSRHAGRLVTTLEATDAVRDGDNALEVVCEHPRDIENTPWQCGGCGYCTCESPEAFGLFRRVRLVTTGRARVAPFGLHVWHDGECRTAFVEAEVDTGGIAAEDLKVRFVSKELGVDKVLPCAKTVRGEFALGDVERWSPKHPKMYEVTAEILDRDGRIVDAETVRTGFASVRWPLAGASDNRFFLNGEPTFVHGTAETDHRLGDRIAFDDEEVDARVGEVKRLGFNMFREGHEPHGLRYLSQMEERGLMCWAGFSTRNYADTEEFRRTFLECVGQWVKERRNSPAVVIWGLQNESALPHEFARECTELVRKLDPLSGPKGRPVVTCNGGDGTDWNVVQNWSGTYEGYGGTLMTYAQDLAKPSQLLNGEYGAWRVAGWHSDPDEPFDLKGAWTEEHQARVLYEKLMRGWKARDRVCGHLLWTFFSHCNPGRDSRVEEGYREIDKTGPVNMKGLYTLDGRRVEAWYLYLAFGRHFEKGDLAEHVDRPLSWWLAEGRRLAAAPAAAECRPEPLPGKTYIHRLNCGGDAVTDSCGNRWMADDSRYVSSWSQDGDMQIKGYELNPVLGSQGVVDGGVSNAAKEDQELFGTFRYGRSRQSFALPAPANATCEVEVYFVEPGSYGRMFDVAINGKVVDSRLRLGDMVPERNVVRRRYEVDTGTNSEIRITFPRVQVNQATVAAIAVSTDAQSAARMPPELRKPGYPESDGLTWKELSARVRHLTPARLLPLGGRAAAMKKPLCALPFPDKGGYHRVLFHPYAAGSYSIRFRVVAGDPVGKRVKWKIEAESWVDDGVDRTIKTGEAILAGPVTEDGFIDMPMDVFVNAGGYFVSYMIEDDSLSAREFRQ